MEIGVVVSGERTHIGRGKRKAAQKARKKQTKVAKASTRRRAAGKRKRSVGAHERGPAAPPRTASSRRPAVAANARRLCCSHSLQALNDDSLLVVSPTI